MQRLLKPSSGLLFASTIYVQQKYNLPLLIPPDNAAHSFESVIPYWYVNSFNVRQICIPNFFKGIFHKFIKNRNQRFFAFPIVLCNVQSVIQPCRTNHCNHNMNHVNMVIYDKKYSLLERYDSVNNYYEYDSFILDTTLVNTFCSMFGVNVKGANAPWAINDDMPFQELQESEVHRAKVQPILGENIGFCSVYAVWYLETRLKNQKLSPTQAVRTAMSNIAKHQCFTAFIRMYTKEIIGRSTSLLQHLDKNSNIAQPNFFTRQSVQNAVRMLY